MTIRFGRNVLSNGGSEAVILQIKDLPAGIVCTLRDHFSEDFECEWTSDLDEAVNEASSKGMKIDFGEASLNEILDIPAEESY